jgi:pyruvate,orthophosphate dikinase
MACASACCSAWGARVAEPAIDAPLLIACGDVAAAADLPPQARIGAKAHNLARMAALGLPVPPAFVIGSHWCGRAHALQPDFWCGALRAIEQVTGRGFGDRRHPLLLSVRSGAAVSMPGMMETVLDIGLSELTLPGFVRVTGNPQLAWDAYRRLVAGFGEVVLGVDRGHFERDLQGLATGRDERELDFAELRQLTRLHLASVLRESGRPFPQDPGEQLRAAIAAVFGSWQADKALAYRRLHGLPDQPGTAVTVQAMVFGNAGGTSGAGVGFTRHPSTGAPEPWVDFLFKAQGEDVVSGRRTAQGHAQLAAVAPAIWDELRQHLHRLEQAFGDMQDFEFTVENGKLWLLQTRAGKRTPQARARIALDLLDEGVIDAPQALLRTVGLDAATLAIDRIATDGAGAEVVVLATAASAAHGVACGEIALDEARARARHAAGAPVVLLRQDAETRDLVALECALGLLTARGARTSHAAVVARQMGKVCLVGCDELAIDLGRRRVRFGSVEMGEGEPVTLDGHRGVVYRGAVRTVREAPAELLQRLAALRARA